MKKTIAFLLVFSMLFALCACGEETSGPIRKLSFYKTNDITVRVGETTKDSYSNYVSVSMKSGKELSLDDVLFVSDNPDVAIISLSKESSSKLYYVITGVGGGETTVYASSADGSVVSEKIKVTVPQPIEAEKIELTLEKAELAVWENVAPTVKILPENTDDKTVLWASSDETVATVSEEGIITALGGGTTTITASTKNGITSSVDISVDGSKYLMKVVVTHPRDDDNNIGEEWSYRYEVNGERPASNIAVSVGEKLNFYAKFTEEDKNPDVGEAQTAYVVKEDDITNGFTITMDLYVKENGGQNSGKAAHFIVTYTFTPIA